MLYHNEGDIEMSVRHFRNHTVLGPATRVLQRLFDLVNQNSDGWAYWKAPVRSAKKLMEMIDKAKNGERASFDTRYQPYDPTPEDFKKALIPIKAFCTKHKLAFPSTE